MDASGLIENCGGDEAFASAIDARIGTVRVWKTRARIPRTAWPEIMRAYPAVTLDLLMATETAALTDLARAG